MSHYAPRARRGAALIYVTVIVSCTVLALSAIIAVGGESYRSNMRRFQDQQARYAFEGALAQIRWEIDANDLYAPATRTLTLVSPLASATVQITATITDNAASIDNTYRVDQVTTVTGRTYRLSTIIPAPQKNQGLLGEYFQSNVNSGIFASSVLKRIDDTVDFAWGTGSPSAAVPSDDFAVRWTGSVKTEDNGNYSFTTMSDSGVRLWIDGQLVIDNWVAHSSTLNTSPSINLRSNTRYNVVMEYYESTGSATARLYWRRPGQSLEIIPKDRLSPYGVPVTVPSMDNQQTSGLRGQYFNSAALTGIPLEQIDGNVDFNWRSGSPRSGIDADDFGVRWSGKLVPTVSGSYVFSTSSKDGVRLWVNGVQILSNWTNHSTTTNFSTPISLTANSPVTITLEYYNASGSAVCRLLWQPPGAPSAVAIPSAQLTPDALGIQESLAGQVNLDGVSTGANPSNGSFDGAGNSLNGDLFGSSVTLDNATYVMPSTSDNQLNVVQATGQTLPLTAGNYSQVNVLCAASQGPATATFRITYSDASFIDSTWAVGDWLAVSNVAQAAASYSSYNGASGSKPLPAYLYVLPIPVSAGKTVQSIRLPADTRIKVLAITDLR